MKECDAGVLIGLAVAGVGCFGMAGFFWLVGETPSPWAFGGLHVVAIGVYAWRTVR